MTAVSKVGGFIYKSRNFRNQGRGNGAGTKNLGWWSGRVCGDGRDMVREGGWTGAIWIGVG